MNRVIKPKTIGSAHGRAAHIIRHPGGCRYYNNRNGNQTNEKPSKNHPHRSVCNSGRPGRPGCGEQHRSKSASGQPDLGKSRVRLRALLRKRFSRCKGYRERNNSGLQAYEHQQLGFWNALYLLCRTQEMPFRSFSFGAAAPCLYIEGVLPMSMSITTNSVSRLGALPDQIRRLDVQLQSASGTPGTTQVSISKQARALLEQEQATTPPLSLTPEGHPGSHMAIALDDFSSPVGKISQSDAYRKALRAILEGSDWMSKIPKLKSLTETLLEEAGLRKRSTKPVTSPDL